MFGWINNAFGRSSRWKTIRQAHLRDEPCCVACGRSRQVDVHHVVPVSVDPDRELDPDNLITLCSDPCHFVHGHLLDWKKSNPHVREDAARYFGRIQKFG